MQTENLEREFRYNGAKLTDPSPAFTLQQVRDFYSNTYPEIVNAEIEGPEIVGNRNLFTFRRAVGTKGHVAGTTGRLYITGVGVTIAAPVDELLSVRAKIDAVLQSSKPVPLAIRVYLAELERFASAHVCPLLDEEVAFVNALHARYAG